MPAKSASPPSVSSLRPARTATTIDALLPLVSAIRVGGPVDETTRLAALITPDETERVTSWIDKAVRDGAVVLTGGERSGHVPAPTIVADVRPGNAGRARGTVRSCRGRHKGGVAARRVQLANQSSLWSQSNVRTATPFASQADVGMVMINSAPLWRADLMPYGGVRRSGFGREGPRYAVQEMTQLKTIVFRAFRELLPARRRR
jgi:acyl-CoA reductase-like NAD-dependent aldehyde dehydrogenase